MHHWDVAHVAGDRLEIDGDIASDAIAELLTVSVSSWSDPADPPRAPLNGRLGLWCTDLDESWTGSDGHTEGTIAFERGVEDEIPALKASSSDLLLWLYSRVDISGDAQASALGRRLHALSFTN